MRPFGPQLLVRAASTSKLRHPWSERAGDIAQLAGFGRLPSEERLIEGTGLCHNALLQPQEICDTFNVPRCYLDVEELE